jgi:hypothetical protein
LLLLIGTPGTGKRPVADYLAGELGFAHLDFDDKSTREGLLSLSRSELRARLRRKGNGVVITWRAASAAQLAGVRHLQSAGVQPVWFDSDRGSACAAYLATASRRPRFAFVDPFEADGAFRPLDAVVADLLGPLRARVPAHQVRRRYGDAVAFLAGAAAATAAVLFAVGGTTSSQPRPPALVKAAPVHHLPALPKQGVLVSGTSLAGVRLGDTMATVRALWGGRFTRCGTCKPAMWFFFYPPPDDPVGAGVEFQNGRVVAVFTLGSPPGWHTASGIRVGQILDDQFESTQTSKWLSCTGYSAQLTSASSSSVTSILTQGPAVYGFALTRPSVSPCH